MSSCDVRERRKEKETKNLKNSRQENKEDKKRYGQKYNNKITEKDTFFSQFRLTQD